MKSFILLAATTLTISNTHCIGHGCEILNKPPGTYCQYFTPDKIVAVSPKATCGRDGIKVTIEKGSMK